MINQTSVQRMIQTIKQCEADIQDALYAREKTRELEQQLFDMERFTRECEARAKSSRQLLRALNVTCVRNGKQD